MKAQAPHRNPLVAAVMKKAVRKHGKSGKAQRQADRIKLHKEY